MATYQVTGMTCEHCVNAVKEEVGAIDGVQGVEVDLDAGGTSQVHVTGTQPSRQALLDALDEAGEYQLQDA